MPSEHSSAGNTHRRGITKTGNKHVRRVLIEASWHYRHRPALGVRLRQRRRGQPGDIIAIADRAQTRLHRRYLRLCLGSNKPPNIAVVAVARELAGFIWAALYPRAEEVARARAELVKAPPAAHHAQEAPSQHVADGCPVITTTLGSSSSVMTRDLPWRL